MSGETTAVGCLPQPSQLGPDVHPGGRWGAMQNELVSQIFTGPPQIVLVSTSGVLELERRRPVDILEELLQVRMVGASREAAWITSMLLVRPACGVDMHTVATLLAPRVHAGASVWFLEPCSKGINTTPGTEHSVVSGPFFTAFCVSPCRHTGALGGEVEAVL